MASPQAHCAHGLGKTTITVLPPPRSILLNPGKTEDLPGLPPTAPLSYISSILDFFFKTMASIVELLPYVYNKININVFSFKEKQTKICIQSFRRL